MNLLRVVLIARGNTKNKASPQSHSLWKSKEAGSLTSSMRNLKKDISLTKQGVKIISSNKTVYTIPDDTEFRATSTTSIAWKLPYFELKKYITKIRLPSQNGIKIQV